MTLDVIFWNDIMHAALALFCANTHAQNSFHVSWQLVN